MNNRVNVYIATLPITPVKRRSSRKKRMDEQSERSSRAGRPRVDADLVKHYHTWAVKAVKVDYRVELCVGAWV